ncbi:MAG: ABC transporter permease [bacterium]
MAKSIEASGLTKYYGKLLAVNHIDFAFVSGSAQSPGQVMMPSTLLRWPLLFVSGISIPLREMSFWARALSYASPLTYAQDLMNHAVLGEGAQSLGLDAAVLPPPSDRISHPGDETSRSE